LAITGRGFYWGVNSFWANNILGSVVSTDTSATFTYTKDTSALTTGDVYYVTAWATTSEMGLGIGDTRRYIIGDGCVVVPPPEPKAPTVYVSSMTDRTSTTVTLNGSCTAIGDSNVTSYGFYIGANGTDYNENTKVPVASGVSLSAAFDFTAARTGLTSGTTYYVNAWAVNTQGEGVSPMRNFGTCNVMNVKNATTDAVSRVVYNGSYSANDCITISTGGADCYTLLLGCSFSSNISGLPTITGVCGDCGDTVTPDPPGSCTEINLLFHTSAENVCCKDPAQKTAFIDAANFSDATKLYDNNDCSTLTNPSGTIYLTEDIQYYRSWNPSTEAFGALTGCPDCYGDEGDDPDFFELKIDNVISNNKLATYNDTYSVGERVLITGDSENCWEIISEGRNLTPTETISASCATSKPVISEVCPTPNYWRRYLRCADDEIRVISNVIEDFPDFIKEISTDNCYSIIGPAAGGVTFDDQDNLGCTPTSKYESNFVTCDGCLGRTDTTTEYTTTTTIASIFYHYYESFESDCTHAAGKVIEVYNTVDSFPSVVTDGVECFGDKGEGGTGADGLVTSFVSPATCAACLTYIAGLVTTQPTTTETPCVQVTAYVTTVALNACCTQKRSSSIYINSTILSSATIVYTDSNCTSTLGTGNYIVVTGRTYYFWTGYSIVSGTCPSCL